MKNKENSSDSYFKSIFIAYVILFLHILLLVVLGCLIIFFRGIINYTAWIFLAVFLAVVGSGFYFYRRMKKEGKTLKEILNSSTFSGRAVEVSFLGGFATFRLGSSDKLLLDDNSSGQFHQLTGPDNSPADELVKLVQMLEKGLITLDEYNKAKGHILK